MNNQQNNQQQPDADPSKTDTFDLVRAEYTDTAAREIGLPSMESMKVMKRVATELAGTPFCPKGFANNPAAIFAAILTGKEMNLSPMQALRSFFPSPDGRLGMYAQAMMALMLRNKFRFEWHEISAERCEVTASRPDGNSIRIAWTKEDAQRAELLTDSRQYKRYPADMLQNRVLARVFRFLGADLGGNSMYLPDEIDEIRAEEGIETTKQDTAPPPAEVVIGRKPKAKATEPVVTVDAKPDPLMNAAAATPPALPDMAAQSPRGAAFAGESAGPDPDPAHSKESVMKTYNEVMAGADPQRRFYTAPPADKTQAPAAPETQGPKSGPTEVSATPSETSNAARDRLASLYPKTPGKTAAEKKTNAHSFLSGWFGINNPSLWPKNAVDRQAALDALEKAIAEEPAEVLLYKAHQTGAKRREQSEQDDSAGYYAKLGWGDDTRMAAKALKRRYAHSAEDFVEFCQHFGLNKLPEADAAAFLAFATAAGRGNSLLKQIRELSTRLGDGYGSIVGSIENYRSAPITDIPVTDLEHYFQRVTDRLNAEAPPSQENTETAKRGA